MIKLIRADLKRITAKKSFTIVIVLLSLYSMIRVFIPLLEYEGVSYVAVRGLMNAGKLVDLIIGIFVFGSIYSDDFKSMSYVQAIGRGFSRSKIVFAKLIDVFIACIIVYGVIAAVLTGLVKLGDIGFGHTLTYAWFLTIFTGFYKTVGYIALASMVLYVTNNIPISTVVLVVLYIAVPMSSAFLNLNERLRDLHIDRIHYVGLADNAMADFMFGSYLSGILKYAFGLVVYMGIVVFTTQKWFEKKELEF